MKLASIRVPLGAIAGPPLFNIVINDIVKASSKFALFLKLLTQLLTHLEMMLKKNHSSIISELKKIFKWLDVNK